MKNKFLFILFFILAFGFISAVAITDDLHLNIQTTDTSGNIVTGTFDFVFNISNTSDCSNIIYTNSTSLATDSRGIISYYLPNVSLDYNEQYWLCYYRDGSLISNSKIARIPYAFRGRNITLSGIEIDSNFNLSTYNFTTLGRVGIGTGSPARKFHIEDSGTVYMLINSTTSGSTNEAGIYLDRGDVANGYAQLHLRTNSVPLNKWDIGMYAGSGGLRFYDYSGTPGIRLFIENNTGNVGIGTTSPANRLDIRNADGNDTIGVGLLTLGLDNPYWTFRLAKNTGLADLVIDRLYAGTDYEVMRIQRSTGNVGIGTTNPSQKLDVVGAIQLSDNSGSNEAGTIRWTGSDFQGYNGSSWNTFATSGGGSLWGQSGDDIYYNNGYVGIGTTSPVTKLTVKNGTDVAAISIDGKSTSGDDEIQGELRFYRDTTIPPNAKIVSVQTVSGDNDVVGLGFYTHPSGVGSDQPVEALRIDGSGKVGIGTTNPLNKLDIVGQHPQILLANTEADDTSKYSSVAARQYDSTGEPEGFSLIAGYSLSTSNAVIIGGGISEANAATQIRFMTAANKSTRSGPERMRIDSAGNVGIGTTSPDSILAFDEDTDVLIGINRGAASDGTDLMLRAGVSVGEGNTGGDLLLAAGGDSVTGAGAGDIIFGYAGNDDTVALGETWMTITAPLVSIETFLAVAGEVNIGDTADKLRLRDDGSAAIIDSEVNDLTVRTSGNKDIIFQTNGANTRVHIDADGKVGIGTTNPSEIFTVSRPANTGELNISIGTDEASSRKAIIRKDTSSPYDMSIVYSANPTAAGGALKFFNKNNVSAEVMRIDATGNVGIGTTAPGELLDVKGAAPKIRLTDNVSGTWSPGDILGAYEFYTSDTSAPGVATVAKIQAIHGRDRAADGYPLPDIGFFTWGTDAALTERMTIQYDGNVGIGTTSPGTKLEVRGSVAISDTTTIPLSTLAIYPNNTFGSFSKAIRFRLGGTAGGADGFVLSAFDDTTKVLAFQSSTGNVGIGTTSPSVLLDISGTGEVANFGNGTGEAGIKINGAVENVRDIRLQTDNSNRWIIRADGTAESGSDAGSDFQIVRRDDAGGNLGAAIFIKRSNGYVNIGGDVTPNEALTIGPAKAISINERADAPSHTAAFGKLWVKNTNPSELWFTDDAGTSTKIV